jgi:hypothetical protein
LWPACRACRRRTSRPALAEAVVALPVDEPWRFKRATSWRRRAHVLAALTSTIGLTRLDQTYPYTRTAAPAKVPAGPAPGPPNDYDAAYRARSRSRQPPIPARGEPRASRAEPPTPRKTPERRKTGSRPREHPFESDGVCREPT